MIFQRSCFTIQFNKTSIFLCSIKTKKQFVNESFLKLLRPKELNSNSVRLPNNLLEYFKKLSNPDYVDYIVDIYM